MYPERRLEFHLERQGRGDHDRAEDRDHEHRGPVTGIIRPEIETATLAFRSNREQAR
jgi:hypothetical protein